LGLLSGGLDAFLGNLETKEGDGKLGEVALVRVELEGVVGELLEDTFEE